MLRSQYYWNLVQLDFFNFFLKIYANNSKAKSVPEQDSSIDFIKATPSRPTTTRLQPPACRTTSLLPWQRHQTDQTRLQHVSSIYWFGWTPHISKGRLRRSGFPKMVEHVGCFQIPPFPEHFLQQSQTRDCISSGGVSFLWSGWWIGKIA